MALAIDVATATATRERVDFGRIAAPLRIRIGDIVVLPNYINWKTIVEDINAAFGRPINGNVRVARLLNIPPTTVQRWRDSPTPGSSGRSDGVRDIGYCHGEALLELHSRAVGGQQTLNRLQRFRELAMSPRFAKAGTR